LTGLTSGFALTVVADTLHARQPVSTYQSVAGRGLRHGSWHVTTVFGKKLHKALRVCIIRIVTNEYAGIAFNLPTDLAECNTGLSKENARTKITNSAGREAGHCREIATSFWKATEVL